MNENTISGRHASHGGWAARRLLEPLQLAEVRAIMRGRSLPFGASILAVARKQGS